MNTENHSQTAAFLWSIADLLRGDFKQSQYGRIILPFTLLRRMECVLAPTKEAVLAQAQEHWNKPDLVREKLLLRAAGQQFFNASKLSLATLSEQQTWDCSLPSCMCTECYLLRRLGDKDTAAWYRKASERSFQLPPCSILRLSTSEASAYRKTSSRVLCTFSPDCRAS